MLSLASSVSLLALAAVSLAQGNRPVPVTGVPVSPNGPVPLRQNINDLQKTGPQWDLYIQALAAMQKVNSADPLGYFQISGIHGQPYMQWNNSGPRQGDGWLGYCPHGENLFLTWHRPYVLLYEQILVGTAKKIAATYPAGQRQKYQQAADALRAPFWDWASQASVPQATVPSTLKINVPNGAGLRVVDFPNPLATYNFPQDALSGRFGPFNPGNSRVARCTASRQSYPATANANIQARPYRQWIYDVFTRSQNFNDFATTAGSTGINLEQIHNAIHWDGACGQQFLSPDYAGFDPLFMLHHANVDRFWAYWSAIKPEAVLFSGSYRGQSRWATRSGTVITTTSPLQPFYQANGQFHTSQTVASIRGMGYTYAGMEYWQKSAAQMKTDVTRLINTLYGNNSPRRRTDKLDARQGGSRTRYFVGVSVDVTEVERPCEVNVYISGQMAGSVVVMALPSDGIMKGGFTVDKAIQRLQSEEQGQRNAVSGFQSDVEVEIIRKDGTFIAIDTVPSLNVTLETVDVTPPPKDDELPRYGKGQRHSSHPSDRSRRGGRGRQGNNKSY